MFTRNFWKYQAADAVGKSSEITGNYNIKPNFITVDGTTGKKAYGSYEYSGYQYYPTLAYIQNALKSPKFVDVSANIEETKSSAQTKFGYGVFFGSGNAAATIDDVKLSGASVLNCVCSVTKNNSYASDGSNFTFSYNYTITNNNDTEIVIGEVGIFFEWCCKTSSTKTTNFFHMCERTALETPITIPAGGVGQVTYTIKMEYPVPPIEE